MNEVGRRREVGPPRGSVLPAIRLPDQTGRLVDLHEYRKGDPALLVAYRSAVW